MEMKRVWGGLPLERVGFVHQGGHFHKNCTPLLRGIFGDMHGQHAHNPGKGGGLPVEMMGGGITLK